MTNIRSELIIKESAELESVLASTKESVEPDFSTMTEKEVEAWILAHTKSQ